jgi:hypothetical protein
LPFFARQMPPAMRAHRARFAIYSAAIDFAAMPFPISAGFFSAFSRRFRFLSWMPPPSPPRLMIIFS